MSLAQTIVWCSTQDFLNDPANSLRTAELRPPSFLQLDTVARREAMMDTLVEKRFKLLRFNGKYRILPAKGLAGGRLVVYDPDQNRFDSMALVESFGYFDWDNLPPWDTWIAYVRDEERERQGLSHASYLVAWVPPDLIERADAGIRANPERCLLWASDLDTERARQLESLEDARSGWLRAAYRGLTSRLTPARRGAPR